MNEIIQRLVDKTGLPEDQATAALDTIVGYLKEKLPQPIASQIDGLVSGESESGSGLGDKLGGIGASLGGLFGKKE